MAVENIFGNLLGDGRLELLKCIDKPIAHLGSDLVAEVKHLSKVKIVLAVEAV